MLCYRIAHDNQSTAMTEFYLNPELEVDYFGELVKLHAVWDSKLIESQLLSFSEWVDFLDHAASEEIR